MDDPEIESRDDVEPGDEDSREHVDESTSESGLVDQLGIPMSRAPTLDDVRGDSEPHRRMAVGCSLITVIVVAAFWLWRM